MLNYCFSISVLHLALIKTLPYYTCCSCRCAECQKTFQYPSQLQNHMMKHKDIRPYICSECGMEFIQSHHLKQHTLTHKVGLIRRTKRIDTAFCQCFFFLTGVGSKSMDFAGIKQSYQFCCHIKTFPLFLVHILDGEDG